MKAILLVVLSALAIRSSAQMSDFPKNYVGLFYVNGYYTDWQSTPFGNTYNGVDMNSIGLSLARRLTQNIYLQSTMFPVAGQNFFIDGGVKLNFLVNHKLQPSGTASLGSRLGFSESTNFYYGFGLDWHVLPQVVFTGMLVSDYSVNAQFVRFGGSYKF